MNRLQSTLILLAILLAAGVASTAQPPVEKRRTVLSVLQVGQSVAMKEVAGRYEISTIEAIPDSLGYKVMEVADDHLVVQDISGVHEIHIPVYSIKAIIRVKLPKQ